MGERSLPSLAILVSWSSGQATGARGGGIIGGMVR